MSTGNDQPRKGHCHWNRAFGRNAPVSGSLPPGTSSRNCIKGRDPLHTRFLASTSDEKGASLTTPRGGPPRKLAPISDGAVPNFVSLHLPAVRLGRTEPLASNGLGGCGPKTESMFPPPLQQKTSSMAPVPKPISPQAGIPDERERIRYQSFTPSCKVLATGCGLVETLFPSPFLFRPSVSSSGPVSGSSFIQKILDSHLPGHPCFRIVLVLVFVRGSRSRYGDGGVFSPRGSARRRSLIFSISACECNKTH